MLITVAMLSLWVGQAEAVDNTPQPDVSQTLRALELLATGDRLTIASHIEFIDQNTTIDQRLQGIRNVLSRVERMDTSVFVLTLQVLKDMDWNLEILQSTRQLYGTEALSPYVRGGLRAMDSDISRDYIDSLYRNEIIDLSDAIIIYALAGHDEKAQELAIEGSREDTISDYKLLVPLVIHKQWELVAEHIASVLIERGISGVYSTLEILAHFNGVRLRPDLVRYVVLSSSFDLKDRLIMTILRRTSDLAWIGSNNELDVIRGAYGEYNMSVPPSYRCRLEAAYNWIESRGRYDLPECALSEIPTIRHTWSEDRYAQWYNHVIARRSDVGFWQLVPPINLAEDEARTAPVPQYIYPQAILSRIP